MMVGLDVYSVLRDKFEFSTVSLENIRNSSFEADVENIHFSGSRGSHRK